MKSRGYMTLKNKKKNAIMYPVAKSMGLEEYLNFGNYKIMVRDNLGYWVQVRGKEQKPEFSGKYADPNIKPKSKYDIIKENKEKAKRAKNAKKQKNNN